jgi:hypothetical protein
MNRLIISSPFKKKTGLRCAGQSHYDATAPLTLFLSIRADETEERAMHCGSVWEWPATEFLLANLPQTGQTMRLDNQEKNNQSPENDRLNVFCQIDGYI